MKREYVVPIGALLAALWGTSVDTPTCVPALVTYGIDLPTCPAGTLRQTAELSVSGLRRGADGTVSFQALAHYVAKDSDTIERTSVPSPSVKLSLIDAAGKVRPMSLRRQSSDYGVAGVLKLPDVPDGDYKLRADYTTRLGTGVLDLALPLYAPARIHVITDRPLYEPGNVVKFRAVVLRARDLSPIDGRPGMWVVTDPTGEVLLEEKAPAGDWGVVAGSFPLDKAAPTGSWKIAWVSGDARDEVAVAVEPFTLPRFRVDATTPKPFYLPGDTPAIRGAVVYSSGAPVSKATLAIEWNISGAWPTPPDWQTTRLPKQLVTGANGRFELALPEIPRDLQGRVTMVANISAVDSAGDRVATSIPVLLSEHGIEATAVTELGNGLVAGFNNRMYVRVTTPDGRVVPNAKVNIKRVWQADDPGTDTVLDEDGVASLQLDPGPPVNIVIPALPYRPVPRAPLVTRGEVDELIGGEGASLADQVEMDRWLAALLPCAKWVGEAGASDDDMSDGGSGVRVGFRVNAGGAILAAGADTSPLGRCVVAIVRGKRLPGGSERMYTVSFNFGDPDLPTLTAGVESALEVPDGLQERFGELAASTRDCLPAKNSEGALPQALTWSVRAGSKDVELGGWIRDPQGAPNAAQGCVQSRVGGRIALAEKAESDSLGIVRFSVSLPARLEADRPQPTTMVGYELRVAADIEGAPHALLRVEPGTVPDLRLRVSPILAAPGDTITAELIRGPSFSGELPKELVATNLKIKPLKAKLDADRKTTFKIDPAVEGWVEVTGAGQRALVYVKPKNDLAVKIVPGKDRYAPGQMAELAITTQIGGKGGKAAVSLVGVDESLGQLVPLPGPDAMSRVQPTVTTSSPAFGTLDGQALALGRIRGANAAAATVLRVMSTPSAPELDAVVSTSASSGFDAVEELTDRFYIVLEELHEKARVWEATAPPTEKMKPRTMARLWNAALDAVTKRGGRIDDAYGRPLRLSRLPMDLLALVDPRSVIVVGTRLPEDVENWSSWVIKEKP